MGFFRPGDPIELLGGQLIVAEPQGSGHFAAIRAVQDALRAAFGGGWDVRTQGPLALDDESEPEPESHPALFEGVPWGSDRVIEVTRGRLRALGLRWSEPTTLWDLDRPADLDRLATLPLGYLADPGVVNNLLVKTAS